MIVLYLHAGYGINRCGSRFRGGCRSGPRIPASGRGTPERGTIWLEGVVVKCYVSSEILVVVNWSVESLSVKETSATSRWLVGVLNTSYTRRSHMGDFKKLTLPVLSIFPNSFKQNPICAPYQTRKRKRKSKPHTPYSIHPYAQLFSPQPCCNGQIPASTGSRIQK
jgi:hypothetical protein